AENFAAVLILLGEPLSFQEADHVVTPRIWNRGERKLFEVAPVFGVSGVIEMFSSEIRVKPVGERIMRRTHMPAGTPARFEHGNVMAAPPQLICAGEARDARADHDHPLLRAGILDRKSTRLNSSHVAISYAVFCLKK